MKQKDVILFDNDGVLVDTEYLFYLASAQILHENGIDLGEKEFAELSIVQGRSMAEIIVTQGGRSEAYAEQERQRRNVLYDEMLMEKRNELVIPGVPEALDALHKKFRIGIVTCCQTMHFKTIHEVSGLKKYFDFVVGDDDFVLHKPHPEPYLTALKTAGVTAECAIAVEDSERGILSAKRAGIETVAIPRGLSLYGSFTEADHRLDHIGQFVQMMLDR